MLKGITPRLSELGAVRIGKKSAEERQSKSGTSWRAPMKLDHFIITGNERDSKGDLKVDTSLMERLVKECGSPDGKLRELPIAFLSDDIDEVLTAAYCWYDSRRLVARCDGEKVTWFRDRAGNRVPQGIVRECNGEHETMLDQKGKPRFKLHATLHFVIASGEARWGGIYKFRTTSKITTDQLYGSLLHLQSLTYGILQGIPLRLVVRPVEVAPDGKSTTVYVVHIELRGRDLSAVQQQALQLAQVRIANEKQLRAVRSEYVRLLKAPGIGESEEEQADVAEEFVPGPENGKVVETTKVEPQKVEEAPEAAEEDAAPDAEEEVADAPEAPEAPAPETAPAKAAPTTTQPSARPAASKQGNGTAPPPGLADLPI